MFLNNSKGKGEREWVDLYAALLQRKMKNLSRNRAWKKKGFCNTASFLSISLLFFIFTFVYFCSRFPSSLLRISRTSQCITRNLAGERFMWYAPHSGFSNQVSEFKNAILMAVILNRTLVVPPILDHHAVALGSCPKFRVLGPGEIRLSVWNHVIELLRNRRWVLLFWFFFFFLLPELLDCCNRAKFFGWEIWIGEDWKMLNCGFEVDTMIMSSFSREWWGGWWWFCNDLRNSLWL